MPRGGRRPGAGRPKRTTIEQPDAGLELRRVYQLAKRISDAPGTLTPRAAFERLQTLLRAAQAHMGTFAGPLDADYYDAWRAALLTVGATAREIEAVASFHVCVVVDEEPDPAERQRQFELISEHLVVGDMTVRIASNGVVRAVEFPDAPGVQ